MDKSSFTIKEANFIDSNSILFIRVKVNDLSKAVEYILKVFKDESWLKNIEEDYLRESIEACTSDTVKEYLLCEPLFRVWHFFWRKNR